jgi:hypothetical protein
MSRKFKTPEANYSDRLDIPSVPYTTPKPRTTETPKTSDTKAIEQFIKDATGAFKGFQKQYQSATNPGFFSSLWRKPSLEYRKEDKAGVERVLRYLEDIRNPSMRSCATLAEIQGAIVKIAYDRTAQVFGQTFVDLLKLHATDDIYNTIIRPEPYARLEIATPKS